MPFAVNQGVRTHYVVEGSGPPVLLIHGFSGNHTSWVGYGFVAALRERFQLILPDVRGHGASDGPAEPEAYKLETRVADMVAILDDLGVERVHCLGYSMGGMMGYRLAQQHPHRLRSLAAGGASPFAGERLAEPGFLLTLYERAAVEGLDVLVEGIRAWAGAITPAYEARLRSANVAAGAALLRWGYMHPPDFTEALPTLRLPVLLYCGDQDEPFADMQRAASLLPDSRFVALPGMNHVQAAGASAELAPVLTAFWETAS